MSKEIIQRKKPEYPTLDNYLTDLLVNKTMGEICLMWSQSTNVRVFTACSYIVDAISELDIGQINQIIKRIDGATPSVADRDMYANIVGNALDEVLSLHRNVGEDAENDHLLVQPTDQGIIALAKAILYISLDKPGKNVSKRKDRQMATDILLSRTGGNRTQPVANVEETRYVEAPWLNSLGEGNNDGDDSTNI